MSQTGAERNRTYKLRKKQGITLTRAEINKRISQGIRNNSCSARDVERQLQANHSELISEVQLIALLPK